MMKNNDFAEFCHARSSESKAQALLAHSKAPLGRKKYAALGMYAVVHIPFFRNGKC